MNETPNLRDPYHFYFELPLYAKIEITKESEQTFFQMMSSFYDVDAFNPLLGENTTYQVSPFLHFNNTGEMFTRLGHLLKNGKPVTMTIPQVISFYTIASMYVRLTCQRTKRETYILLEFDKDKNILQKVGQYPSIADFHIAKVKDYSKVLNKEKMKELTRAIGLAANGVGVGSYVYLRRIFEHLLEEAHQEAMKDAGWDEEKYKHERVKEKILMLKEHLPKFLTDNIALYGILSKGIHELEENDCLAHFEVVRIGIELILDEKLNEYERKKKQEEATKKISAIAGKLK